MLAEEFWNKNKDYNPIGKKVLLYSGGSDSWLISHLYEPDIKLYINIHGRYSEEEMKRLPDDVIIEDLDLHRWERADAIVPLRNLYFVMLATNYGDDICLGATAGDRVRDKSLEFKKLTNELLNYLYGPQHWVPEGRKINVNIDYKGYTKKQMLKLYLDQGGDIELAVKGSFSCYNPIDGKECFACKPCFRKAVASMINGYKYSENEEKTLYNYMKKEIIPDILEGTYGRGEEEEADILTIYSELDKKYHKGE